MVRFFLETHTSLRRLSLPAHPILRGLVKMSFSSEMNQETSFINHPFSNLAKDRTRQTDVLIVGAGTSGMVAAVAAARRGAQVLVIEKNDYIGGEGLVSACTANFGGGTDYQKTAGIEESADEFYADMCKWDPKADPEVLRAFCDNTVSTCHFLRDLGVRWTLSEDASTADMGMNVMRCHAVVGKGPAFYEVVVSAFKSAGGVALTGTRGLKLATDNKGRVTGVIARDKEGAFAIVAKTTMLTCGGFEGNAELVTRYVSPEANYAMLRGLPTNSGDGLLMGLELGAGTRALHRVHAYVHLPPYPVIYPLHPFSMIPRDGTAALPDFIQTFPYGIVVNTRGERFTDETVPRIGENLCNALIQQPGAVGFTIMDDAVFKQHWKDVVHKTSAFWQNLGLGQVRVETAETIEDLAVKLSVNPGKFSSMVGEYNAAVDNGTTALLPIPKANKDPLGYYEAQNINYLLKIATPPFHAVMIIAGISHTAGGLTINGQCQILDRDSNVIDGLYAGGDTSVLWHSNYGSAYARALVTGYIAGNAMAYDSLSAHI
jgi:succinate dehydrogenase/fumarate reductase flavoprotein subunit